MHTVNEGSAKAQTLFTSLQPCLCWAVLPCSFTGLSAPRTIRFPICWPQRPPPQPSLRPQRTQTRQHQHRRKHQQPRSHPQQHFQLPFTYTVQEGDYLALIVEKFNLGGDGVELILLLNPYNAETGIGIDPATQVLIPREVVLLPYPGMPLPTATPIPANFAAKGTKVEYFVKAGTLLGALPPCSTVPLTISSKRMASQIQTPLQLATCS